MTPLILLGIAAIVIAIGVFATHNSRKHIEPIPKQDAIVEPQKTTKTETHKVAGVTRYIDSIMELAEPNDLYDLSKQEMIDEGLIDEKVFQNDFSYNKVELVPEPNNEYNPKAVMVMIDGNKVGYIKDGSCAHVNKLISDGKIKGIDAEIGYGKYKIITEYEDDDGNEHYDLDKDESVPFVHLSVYTEA